MTINPCFRHFSDSFTYIYFLLLCNYWKWVKMNSIVLCILICMRYFYFSNKIFVSNWLNIYYWSKRKFPTIFIIQIHQNFFLCILLIKNQFSYVWLIFWCILYFVTNIFENILHWIWHQISTLPTWIYIFAYFWWFIAVESILLKFIHYLLLTEK